MIGLATIKKCASATFILLVSTAIVIAQPAQPTGNIRSKLTDLRRSAVDLVRKQRFDDAINVLKSGLMISRQEGLDSFTCAYSVFLATAYRYKAGYDSSFYYLKEAQAIADRKNYNTLKAAIQIESYGILNRLGKADSAAAAIDRMKELLPLLDSNSSEVAKIQMYLGHDGKHKANYTEALGHYFKALPIFALVKDTVNEGNIYISLANIMVMLGQQEKALDYHKQAAELFTQIGRRYELVNELLNITDLYYSSGRLDSAEVTARKALSYAIEMNEKTYQVFAYTNLGSIYQQRKQFAEAEDYFLRSIRVGETLGSENVLIEAYQGLGEMYMTAQQPAKAKPYLEKHFYIAKQKNDREELIEATANMALNERALHHYDKAYEYQKLYSVYKDSAYTESTAKNMAEMESKYQAEKKEKEILLLKKDQQVTRLSLQEQKNFRIGAFVFLALLILIGFLVINRYRVLQRTKRLIEMERMRNTIARDLHDDIGSTLSSINILSKVALHEQTNGADPMGENMRKIKDHSSAIMESMGDIVWAINPQNDTVEQMVSRMKEFTAEILEPLQINYTFREEGDLSMVKLDINKRKDFYLLFKEALNNAAKYSGCKNMSIYLTQDQKFLQLKIVDDGKGFNEQEVRQGNGLRNMRGRAASMQAGIQILTSPGNGTSIAVDVPIT